MPSEPTAATVRCSECGCPVGYIHSTTCSKYPEVHKRSAAYSLAVRVGHVMEWLDEHLPHRAMWLPGRRLICSAADTSYGWGPDATDWQEKATWLDRWIVRNCG